MTVDTRTGGEWVAVTHHTTPGPGPQLFLAEVRPTGAELMYGSFEFVWAPLCEWVPIPRNPNWYVRVNATRHYPHDSAGALVEVAYRNPGEE